MTTRLATLAPMQEQMDRVQRIFPKATLTLSDGADHAVFVHEDEIGGITYIVLLDLDLATMRVRTRGTAIRTRNVKTFELSEALELVSQKG